MEMAPQGKGLPRWRQIEQTLVQEIGAGAHRDARFPTEHELSRRFAVNRHTVRRALAGLVERGLLRTEQGRGSFLVEDAIAYAVGPRTRFSENLIRAGRRPSQEFLRSYEAPATADDARWLKLRPGAPLLVLETLGRADGRAISYGRHAFPLERLPGIGAALDETGSISRALGRLGRGDYRRLKTRITARAATAEEARMLRLGPDRSLLITESVNVDSAGARIEYGIARFAAERVQLVVET